MARIHCRKNCIARYDPSGMLCSLLREAASLQATRKGKRCGVPV